MIRKDFKHGDLIVVTDHRRWQYNGLASVMWVCKYDRDIDIEEAIPIQLAVMQKEYPGMNFTEDMIRDALVKQNKLFLNTDGEVISYENHELADKFDKMYLHDNMWFDEDERLKEISDLKGKWIEETKLKIDEDGFVRCYED